MKFLLSKIQSHIVEPLPQAEVLREKIIFHAFEVESVQSTDNDDYELDIKVLPDRAHDAKDDRGMAREIAALLGLTLREPDQYDRGESVTFSIQKVAMLLGRELAESDVRKIFDAYHYEYEIAGLPAQAGDQVTLFVPPWRKDLVHVYDIADDMGRYLGYDTVPASLPNIEKTPAINTEFAAITAKKNEMIEKGYHEVMTYSLVKKGDFQVAKGPQGKDFLRTNLLDGLRMAYELNKTNREILPNQSANIFEIGRVFLKTGEELHVAWIDEKGEHEEVLDTSERHSGPRAGIQESEHLSQDENTHGFRVKPGMTANTFKMWSSYPFITRDIAVWVPSNTEASELENIYKTEGGELLVAGPTQFDMFTKGDKTSYAHRMVFQAFDRTLTDGEVNEIMERIAGRLKEKGWEVR